MLDIKIDNDYKISNDDRNFILQKKRVITGENLKGRQANPENIGKEIWEDVSYHRTLKQLIEKYTKEKVLKSKETIRTMNELTGLLRDIQKTINMLPDIDKIEY